MVAVGLFLVVNAVVFLAHIVESIQPIEKCNLLIQGRRLHLHARVPRLAAQRVRGDRAGDDLVVLLQ